MELKSSISLDENILRIESNLVSADNENAESFKYAFYIYYYNNQQAEKQLVYTGKYINENVFEYKLEKSGYYYARCFAEGTSTKSRTDQVIGLVKKGCNQISGNEEKVEIKSRIDVFTDTVLFINDDVKNEFEKLMKQELKNEKTINEKLDYYRVPYPFNDFCIISIKNDSKLNFNRKGLENWCQSNKFVIENVERNSDWNTENLIMYTSNKGDYGAQCGKAKNYVFSGYVWKDDKFYFGQDDLPEDLNPEELYEKLGCYSLLSLEQDSIRVTEDYYAYGGVYYYTNDRFFVTTNSYHVLLYVLSFMGNKYELDEEQLYVTFASNVTLFRQPLNDELIIKNTFKKTMCEDIVIDKNGWKIINRPSYKVLSGETRFIEDDYNKYILEAKDEIILNVKTVMENKKFNRFVLELSGGKDSRTTLAALTNVKGYEKKVKIYSIDHEPNDLNTAVGIANLLELQWDDGGYNFILDDIRENIKRRRSCFMAMRYLWHVMDKHEYNLPKMIFNSEGFEAQSVFYYAGTLKGKADINTDEETLLNIYSKICSRQAVISYSEVAEKVKKHLHKGMAKIPGKTPLWKFDNLFTFYRENCITGNLDRNYYTSSTCSAVQSKSLLKAKTMWFHNFEENKVIFDILYALNPVLASLPFNNNKFTKAHEKMKDKLFYSDERFKNLNIKPDTDRTKYNEAAEIRKKNTHISYSDSYVNNGTIEEIVFDNCLLGIKELSEIMDGKFKYDICLPLYYYINAEKDDDVEVRIIHNKVYSILDSIDAISYNIG